SSALWAGDTLWTSSALWAGDTLWTSSALRAGDTLWTGSALRAGDTLWTRGSLPARGPCIALRPHEPAPSGDASAAHVVHHPRIGADARRVDVARDVARHKGIGDAANQ